MTLIDFGDHTCVGCGREMGDTMADLQAAGYREATVERTLLRAGRYDLWATIRPGDVLDMVLPDGWRDVIEEGRAA